MKIKLIALLNLLYFDYRIQYEWQKMAWHVCG